MVKLSAFQALSFCSGEALSCLWLSWPWVAGAVELGSCVQGSSSHASAQFPAATTEHIQSCLTGRWRNVASSVPISVVLEALWLLAALTHLFYSEGNWYRASWQQSAEDKSPNSRVWAFILCTILSCWKHLPSFFFLLATTLKGSSVDTAAIYSAKSMCQHALQTPQTSLATCLI